MRSAGCPKGVMEQLKNNMAARDAQQRGRTEHFTKQHQDYVQRITAVPKWETEVVRCGLDRHPKGSAVFPQRTYFSALHDNFVEEAMYYKMLETAEEKKNAPAELSRQHRKLCPTWMPRLERKKKMTEKGLGFEYINLKEKCCQEDEAQNAKEGKAVCVIGCQKPHAPWGEVSVQAAATSAREIRSIA